MKAITRFALYAFFALYPINAYAYNSEAQANAALMIISACKWSQMGKIPTSNIMSFAKQQYQSKYGSSSNIDWNDAISIAQTLDKQKGIGCFR